MEEERRRLAARREELREQKKVMMMMMVVMMMMMVVIMMTIDSSQMWEKYQKMAGGQPKQNKSLESLLGGRKLRGFVNALNSKVRQ